MAEEPETALGWLRGFGPRYLAEVSTALHALDLAGIHHVTSEIASARDRRATLFVAGNGGSAATATHWVNDLAKATRGSGALPIKAISLTDSTSWLTALANDEGYERVFVGQLENLSQAGDLLIVISASGNSPNLVAAVEFAKLHGLMTAALLGFDGGRLLTQVHHAVWVPSPLGAYGLVENVHSVICDLVTTCLAQPASPYADRLS